jgi:UDP-2,4-diacetamido-2,4,6-trideoxy-beta-L-altropyranose hydrolase
MMPAGTFDVVFRVDASPGIGAGHFTRCLALAAGLQAKGRELAFVGEAYAPGLKVQAAAAGVRVLETHDAGLGWEQDAERFKAMLSAAGQGVCVVVDHYGLDGRWEAAVRPVARRIVVIDDLPDRTHECDLLVDPAGAAAVPSGHRALLPQACRRLSGPKYALLRSEFAVLRAGAAPRPGRVSRVLVSFGGSDPTRETEKVVRALQQLGRHDELRVDIVTGPMNENHEKIARLAEDSRWMRCYREAPAFGRLMLQADLAIGAAGGTAWERCCLYLPSVTIVVAENQWEVSRELAKAGATANLGWHQSVGHEHIAQALERLIGDPAMVRAMSVAAGELVDGLGVGRVVAAMEEEGCA